MKIISVELIDSGMKAVIYTDKGRIFLDLVTEKIECEMDLTEEEAAKMIEIAAEELVKKL